jgi:sulfur-oxidizing protein SoxX
MEIPNPLTDSPGNPGRGLQTIRDVANVTCLICHKMPIAGEPDQGEIGPPLDGVGSRYTPGELRLRLVNPKAFNPNTIMPAYYRVEGLTRVLQQYRDKTIYTAQQIEDVVAYLVQLKGT